MPTEKYPAMTKPVQEVAGFSADGIPEDLIDLGEGHALVSYSEKLDADNAEYVVVDYLEGKVLTAPKSVPQMNRMIGIFRDGTAVRADYPNNRICFSAADHPEREMFSVDMEQERIMDAVYRPETDLVYCFCSSPCRIFSVDASGARTDLFGFDDTGSVVSFDPVRNQFLVFEDSDSDFCSTEYNLYKDSDAHVQCKATALNVNQALICGDSIIRLCSVNGDVDAHVMNLYYDSIRSEESRAFSYGYEDDTYPSLIASPYTSFGLLYTEHYSGGQDGSAALPEITDCLFVDCPTGKYTAVGLPFDTYAGLRGCYAPDTERWILTCATKKENGGYTVRLLTAAPELAVCSDTLPPESEKTEKPELHTLSDAYLPLREKADAVERKYHVRVLIGDEVLNPEMPYDYEIISTEDDSTTGYAGTDWYVNEVDTALTMLEYYLSLYPEDFFDKFRTPRGKGGMRFLIVQKMVSKEYGDSFEAGGLQYMQGIWSMVAIDSFMITQRESTNLHHEIFHAIEKLISEKDPDAFNWEAWNALNPPGFAYSSGFANHSYASDDSVTQYLFDTGNREGAYFATSYGTVTDLEDRATLFETALSPYYSWENASHLTRYHEMMECPHLAEKLGVIRESMKEVLGVDFLESMAVRIQDDFNEYDTEG